MNRFVLSFALCVVLCMGAVQAQSTASGPIGQQNGFSQALSVNGDHVFVGAPQNIHVPGRVYVYERAEDGSWTETTYLEADDGDVGDAFGAAIKSSGETLIVGAPGANAAYVYRAGEEGWTQTARLTAADSTSGFGRSVAVAEGTLFVSTNGTQTTTAEDTTGAAAVHVFERTDAGDWDEQVVLRGSQLSDDAELGTSLSAFSGHLLASASGHEGGVVVAFEQDQESWTEVQTLSASELGNNAQYGAALERAGERVFIGAPRAYDGTGVTYSVSLDGESGQWRTEGRLLPFDGQTRHFFGAALAYDGEDLWVGAPGAKNQAGTLYRFQQEEGQWSGAQHVDHPEAEERDLLGRTLAASPAVVAAGLPGAQHGAGAMALYSLEDNEWSQTSPIEPTTGHVFSALTGEKRVCQEGSVETFACDGVDLQAFLPIRDIGGERGIELNDIWGWTDPETGTEYALVGRTDGTAFVDVSTPGNPKYVGELPLTEGARVNSWRDIKVYENHAYVVADNAGNHGMQVFDLTQLREVDAEDQPVTFEATAHYDRVNSVHNIVINEETGYAYAVGSSGGGETCGGGLHMINIQDPTNPTFEGCFADESTGRSGTGYTHDAQCVVYDGPDEEYHGREICIGYNETAISVADVTDKDNPVAVSTASYPDHAYIHQGWFTDDMRYVYQNDELDEIQGKADRTRTLIWDLEDLDSPRLVKEWLLSKEATDHNLYVKGDRMYQTNYKSGLRILDITDPTNPEEVAHFDTFPPSTASGFQGTWSNYPFFDSGIIVVSSIGEGLFVVSPSEPQL